MLKRVLIQNFKSLKDVTLDLQPVNLLIGPNNSGKTNLLKALEFFQEFCESKVEVTKEIVFARKRANIKIDLSFEYKFPLDDYPTYEHFCLKNVEKTIDTRLLSEYKVEVGETNTVEQYLNEYGSVKKISVDKSYVLHSLTIMGGITIYHPESSLLSKSFPLIPNSERVSHDASNIVAFLDTSRDKNPENFYAIQNDLKKCITEFSQIRFDNVEPSEEQKELYGDKTFKKLGLYHDKLKITVWADELSEGTLFFLALLCIINQPNPPKLLLLEEPERGIHPRRIHEVMDFIFRLAEEKDVQIIMTSHNENVLNEFRSMPEAVFVFDKDDEGATQVKNLQRDIIEPSHQRSRESGTELIDFTGDLGANWMYGLLGGVPKDDE